MSGGFFSPELWTVVALSVKVALLALVIALPLAVAIAYWLARSHFVGKGIVNALVHLPLVLPPVVSGYVLLMLLGRAGPLGKVLESVFGAGIAFRWTGAAVAAAVMAFPLIVRPLRLAFEAIEPGIEDTAKTLGASRLKVFFTISLPLALPGLFAGAVLGFAKALGEFGATITFVSNIPGETQTLSLAIYSLLQSPDGDSAALRLILISVFIAIGAVLVSEWMAGRHARKSKS